MQLNNFTIKAQEALGEAQQIAWDIHMQKLM